MSPLEAAAVVSTILGAICLGVLALGQPWWMIFAVAGVLVVLAILIRVPSTPGSGNDFGGWFDGFGDGFGGGE